MEGTSLSACLPQSPNPPNPPIRGIESGFVWALRPRGVGGKGGRRRQTGRIYWRKHCLLTDKRSLTSRDLNQIMRPGLWLLSKEYPCMSPRPPTTTKAGGVCYIESLKRPSILRNKICALNIGRWHRVPMKYLIIKCTCYSCALR
jgi:hypothetical protein